MRVSHAQRRWRENKSEKEEPLPIEHSGRRLCRLRVIGRLLLPVSNRRDFCGPSALLANEEIDTIDFIFSLLRIFFFFFFSFFSPFLSSLPMLPNELEGDPVCISLLAVSPDLLLLSLSLFSDKDDGGSREGGRRVSTTSC